MKNIKGQHTKRGHTYFKGRWALLGDVEALKYYRVLFFQFCLKMEIYCICYPDETIFFRLF